MIEYNILLALTGGLVLIYWIDEKQLSIIRRKDIVDSDVIVGKQVQVKAEGTIYPGYVVGIGKYLCTVHPVNCNGHR